jgi:hypothetical protein
MFYETDQGSKFKKRRKAGSGAGRDSGGRGRPHRRDMSNPCQVVYVNFAGRSLNGSF